MEIELSLQQNECLRKIADNGLVYLAKDEAKSLAELGLIINPIGGPDDIWTLTEKGVLFIPAGAGRLES